MSSSPSFLQVHRATLTPNGHEWWLLHPVAALTVVDRDQESIDVRIPISTPDYKDALELAGMILRSHKPPKNREPVEEAPAPIRKPAAYYVLGDRAASIRRLDMARDLPVPRASSGPLCRIARMT